LKANKTLFNGNNDIITNKKLVGSVQEYIDVTEYLCDTFGIEMPWYRGVSHSKYALIPKVYRDHLWERHNNYEWWITEDFKNDARAFIPDHHSYSEWDWYFTMQHYGLPTRLLDWTEGSLIALYFAVRNPQNTYIPSVYFLNPYWFDEVVYGEAEGMVYNTDPKAISEEHRSRLSSYLEDREIVPDFPLCIYPPRIDPRIASQKSVFTIHGKFINAFKMVARDNKNAQIVKIRLSTENVRKIKGQLYSMGISEGTLFPGLEGLVEDIKWYRKIN
jgi:hypothetical protein